ncbi:hypothetical protein [Legionella sp. WA2022007384]
MKLIINKKNSGESVTLELESTTAVKDLLFILYSHRSKIYERFSFQEYQKYISVYQCLLYGDRFKNKLFPETILADYQLEDPCHLSWEEFTEARCLLSHIEPKDNRVLFWQGSIRVSKSDLEEKALSAQSESIKSTML